MRSLSIILSAFAALLCIPLNAQQQGGTVLLQGIKANKSSYDLGQSIKFQYAIRNQTSQPITYRFSSSKHYDLWVTLGDKEVYRLSHGKVYLTMMTQMTLKPNETKTFDICWNQKDNDQNQVGPGAYMVHAQLTPIGTKPPATGIKVRIGAATASVVPTTVREAIANYEKLKGKTVTISGAYGGWSSNSTDPNVKDGPPVTRSDWTISDDTGSMYVTGSINLNPVKDVGTKITVTGKLDKSNKGQVYMILENALVAR